MATPGETGAPVAQPPAVDESERGKTDDQGQLIRTVFCSGFPRDVHPREVHNLFRFCDGFESAQVSFKGRVPIAFATFATQDQALNSMAKFQGIKFDDDSHIELRLQLAKSNTTADRTLSVIGGDFGNSRKRSRFEEPPRHDPYGYDPYGGHSGGYAPPPAQRSYAPPSGPAAPEGVITTLFIANMGMNTQEAELEDLMRAQPGFRRMRFSFNGQRPPIAFVEFSDVDTCHAAKNALSGHMLPSGVPGGLRIEISKKQMGSSSRRSEPRADAGGYGAPAPPAGGYAPYGAPAYDAYRAMPPAGGYGGY